MEPTTKPPAQQSSNHPPSVEIAYKRKCIALKKRLNEVESENEIMRLRNKRGWQYVQKMRLESCILLERLAKVTGMAEEAQAGVSPELRARAAGMMGDTAVVNGAAANGMGYYEDETEGSSDEQPPTPQERPLRTKRPRKSNPNEGAEEEASTTNHAVQNNHGSAPAANSNSFTPANSYNPNNNNYNFANSMSRPLGQSFAPGPGPGPNPSPGPAGHPSGLPRLAPAPSQDDLTSSFRVQTGNNGSPVHEGDMQHGHAHAHAHAAGAYAYPHPDPHNYQYPSTMGPGSGPGPSPGSMRPAPESGPTPMDMDARPNHLKEEPSQG